MSSLIMCYNEIMNQLVIRGFNAYKIFLKNKLASSIMMLVSGVMMLIAAINGRGNDTKTLPSLITVVGVILAFWSFYRIGYLKANYDKQADRAKKTAERQSFFSRNGRRFESDAQLQHNQTRKKNQKIH